MCYRIEIGDILVNSQGIKTYVKVGEPMIISNYYIPSGGMFGRDTFVMSGEFESYLNTWEVRGWTLLRLKNEKFNNLYNKLNGNN